MEQPWRRLYDVQIIALSPQRAIQSERDVSIQSMTWTVPTNALFATIVAPYGEFCGGRTSPPDQQFEHRPIKCFQTSQPRSSFAGYIMMRKSCLDRWPSQPSQGRVLGGHYICAGRIRGRSIHINDPRHLVISLQNSSSMIVCQGSGPDLGR